MTLVRRRSSVPVASILTRRSTANNPENFGDLAVWLDASDLETLFQDAAATTPVTSNLDPVGRWNNKASSPPTNHTWYGQSAAGYKMTYYTNSGSPYLYADADELKAENGASTYEFDLSAGTVAMAFVTQYTGTYSNYFIAGTNSSNQRFATTNYGVGFIMRAYRTSTDQVWRDTDTTYYATDTPHVNMVVFNDSATPGWTSWTWMGQDDLESDGAAWDAQDFLFNKICTYQSTGKSYFSEILLYRDLTDADGVRTYLRNRWSCL